MDLDEIMMDIESQLEERVKGMEREFLKVRAGRANPSMIDHIVAEVYGTIMPIKQMANVSVPEPMQLLIKPWDKTTLGPIEKAIAKSDLGIPPQNDGTVIRLNLPPLSTERRKQLAGQVKEIAERAKVALRAVRRDGIKNFETAAKEAKVPEDTVKKTVENISQLLKDYEAKIESSAKSKTDDIMSV